MELAVDKAFCISIKQRLDRQAIAKENLKAVCNETEFWLVEKDVANPERGCFNSHRDIALYGLENGLDRILVFEDDVTFHSPLTPAQASRINQHLMKNQGDLFYLGGILGDIWPTRKWGIAGGRMFCTQSYVMNRKGMEKLASLPYAGTPVDVLYYMEFESFAYYPMLTSQVAGNVVSSDIASVRTGNNNPMSGFWRQNNAAQYWSLLKNWPKSFR